MTNRPRNALRQAYLKVYPTLAYCAYTCRRFLGCCCNLKGCFLAVLGIGVVVVVKVHREHVSACWIALTTQVQRKLQRRDHGFDDAHLRYHRSPDPSRADFQTGPFLKRSQVDFNPHPYTVWIRGGFNLDDADVFAWLKFLGAFDKEIAHRPAVLYLPSIYCTQQPCSGTLPTCYRILYHAQIARLWSLIEQEGRLSIESDAFGGQTLLYPLFEMGILFF